MPSSSAAPDGNGSSDDGPIIDKLDYHPGGRPLVRDANANARESSIDTNSSRHSLAGSYFSEVAEGIPDRDRDSMKQEVARYVAFISAILNALCAGSITAYSLYAPLFQQRLHYTQLQVNGVSITAELAMYLPVPLFGLLCDRVGPGIPSLLAGCWFALGYTLAAFAYKSGPPPSAGGDGWSYTIMILAFIPIGSATSCMYLSSVTTCAKNFGRGKYKGIALALPIACFGLSGMWQSQVGQRLLYETRPDGGKGDVDVHRFFLFLAGLLLATGIIGFFALRVIGEEELIEEVVVDMEQSGLLDRSDYFQRVERRGYGTALARDRRLSADEDADIHDSKASLEESKRRKTWLLNEESKAFLVDHTMWWLAAGFFLVTGPGEAFINNLGTIIGTLYPPASSAFPADATSTTTPATHVSIVAITSTIARLLTGTLTDLLAPSNSTPGHHYHHRASASLSASVASLAPRPSSPWYQISRLTFLIFFSLVMSGGQVLLASGLLQNRASLFWLVSATIGAGYGATFSLVPIIISVVWGVENFGTHWGLVATAPAVGATVWGLVYSGVYQWAAERGVDGTRMGGEGKEVVADVLCYGVMCYAPTFWAMAVSVWVACGLWMWAWRGPDGWWRRGIAV